MTDLLNFTNFFNKKIIIIILILFPLSAYSKEITLPDGSKYRGEIKNGQAHGKGTSTNQNFIKFYKYVGEFKNNKRDGYGTAFHENGSKYIGEFKNNKLNGLGTVICAIKDECKEIHGMFAQGQINGQAIIINKDGGILYGNFKNGSLEGLGFSINKNKDKYFGYYKEGDPNGLGTNVKFNGERYFGQVKNFKANGYGTEIFPSGHKFTGFFRDNLPNGHGILINERTEYFYTGNFKNGKYEGVGTEIFKDGNRYSGQFKNNEYEGRGVYVYSNGDKYTGQFKKGIFEGQGVKIFKDGRKYFGEFKDGQYEGSGTYIYSDRRKYVGDFKKGRFHGSGTLYDKDGKILKESKNDTFEFSFLSKDIINYSILIEEDFNSVMFIYRDRNYQTIGRIFDYENFEFFSKTYMNNYNETISYVQPAYLKISNDQKSYQREDYRLKKFEYNYTNKTLGSSLLTFKVPIEMNKYINESNPFSISTLSKTSWYGGTFTLVQNDNDLKEILNNNSDTFCKIILHTEEINKTIREFKKTELSSLGKKC